MKLLLFLAALAHGASATCTFWCNSYTCGSVASCGTCSSCQSLSAGYTCASWCNRWTCSAQHCKGCDVCNSHPILWCADAEVQSPRDVTSSYVGNKSPRVEMMPVGTRVSLDQVNTHFHLGSEHKSGGQYDQPPQTTSTTMEGRHEADPQLGHYCQSQATLTSAQLTPYTFVNCDPAVQVGQTYEIHYVWSTGGTTISDGLSGAFTRTLNAKVLVEAQVYVITNDPNAPHHTDMMHGMNMTLATDAVKYLGSTTGTSYNNDVCSPYSITWHVDKSCHFVSAASFDAMCGLMKNNYGMTHDVSPHSSRIIVSSSLASTTSLALQTPSATTSPTTSPTVSPTASLTFPT